MWTVWPPGLAAFLTGCQCTPVLPTNQDDDSETTPTGTTGVTGDTGPLPPCPTPEVEPNDTIDTPNELPLEQRGCGRIEPIGNLDFWAFTLEEQHWIEVELKAGNGSIADVSLLLGPEDASWGAVRDDDPDSTDARLVFDASPGDYVVTVNDQNFLGGERYGYDLLVSETKQPFDLVTMEEAEPNDDAATANPVSAGEIVYGLVDKPGAVPDQDWFSIVVPPGKHTLTLDVDGYELGSGADLTARFYDSAGEVIDPPGAIAGGGGGEAPDPLGSYESPGGEVVYIQLLEAFNREGPAAWYVLTIGLVSS